MRSTRLPSSIERLLGLGPRPVPPHVFQVGPQRLRYARFERSEGSVGVLEAREEPLPADCFHSGPLGGPARESGALSAALDRLVSGQSEIEEASLVLPDQWFRLAFGELTELPRGREARAEALRFKLRQLVPFRVDDLRAVGFEVEPLAQQDEPRRVVIGFCSEALLRQLERIFEERRIGLGLVTSESLALQSLLQPPAGSQDLSALLLEEEAAYTLLISSAAGPLLFRHKAYDPQLEASVREAAVVRELRLTRSFLEERLPGRPVTLARVAADDAGAWIGWMRDGLGIEAEPLTSASLMPWADDASGPAIQLPAGWSWPQDGPLLGVALQEVA